MFKVKITSKYHTPYVGYYFINHLNPFELYYISGFYVQHHKSDYNDFEPFTIVYYKIIRVSKEGDYIGDYTDTQSYTVDTWWNSKVYCFNKNLKRLLKKQRYRYYLLCKEDFNIYKGQLIPYCRSLPYKNPAFQLVYQLIPHCRTEKLLKLKNRFKT